MTKLFPARPALHALTWRCIGPPRGGRVVAVAGHPTEPMRFYFGACAGGVWQTTDGGTYWENISDGYFTSAAVGAIAVADADPNVIYVGTGETTIRLDVSYGDGVYRSDDGGKSWRHMGLADTHHIAKIRVHPRDPDLVYVAALGHAFGPNAERGLYRSRDGGQHWEQILFRSDKAGAIDLVMDPTNPRVLYVAFWEALRSFWHLSSGGPDSSLYRSTDGGDTWSEISHNPGLPAGIKGKIGITLSPARPNRIWAIVEAGESGLYRSDDDGATWERLSDNQELLARPWYYCHIFADPQDPDTLYINNLKMWKSTDGGRTFSEITTPHGDNHDLWIDPRNPQRMVQGNDGGACVSFNGGDSWSTIYNQLTAQFYRVAVDNQFPYRLYGTQQDNSSLSVPSATEKGAIPWGDCYPAGTGESGFIAVHPQDPNIVFVGAVGSSPGGGGALQRYDHRTRQVRLVTVWPELYGGWGPRDLPYRFPWTFPIVFSPHDPERLYSTGNLVFRSDDQGSSWQVISPDLTRGDATKLGPSGGPLTLDTSGAEHYATLSTFVESVHEPGLFWAGSDDGLVHISRDGGCSWQNVTPPDLPEWSLIGHIEASPHDPGSAYLAATRYKLDDYRPFLYRTVDYGQSWERLSDRFPVGPFRPEITRVIREDPQCPGLLFVGTETGVVFSPDGGASWQRLQSNLPVVPVYDLLLKDSDLVVATHGRSFWILDDITPLRALAGALDLAAANLLPPRQTVRLWQMWGAERSRAAAGKNYSLSLGAAVTFVERKNADGDRVRKVLDGGENPPHGLLIYYTLPAELPDKLSLEVLNSAGEPIRCFGLRPAGPSAPSDDEDRRYLPAAPGLNRFVWDMRYEDAQKLQGEAITDKSVTGPLAPPGLYQVRLTVGTQEYLQPCELVKDPRVTASDEDLQAQFALLLEIRDKVSAVHRAVQRLRQVRQQATGWGERVQQLQDEPFVAHAAAIGEMVQALVDRLSAIETELVQTEAKIAFDRIRLPTRLNAKLVELISFVASADAAPPQQAYAVFDHLQERTDAQLQALDQLLEGDLVALNERILESGIPAVMA